MKPVLYRYKNSESVIPVMDGYTPGEGWEPLYSQDQISSAVNAALKATAPDERVKERGGPWTRENGGTFTPSHRLCAGGTQFAPYETLDDAIDTAMKGTP